MSGHNLSPRQIRLLGGLFVGVGVVLWLVIAHFLGSSDAASSTVAPMPVVTGTTAPPTPSATESVSPAPETGEVPGGAIGKFTTKEQVLADPAGAYRDYLQYQAQSTGLGLVQRLASVSADGTPEATLETVRSFMTEPAYRQALDLLKARDYKALQTHNTNIFADGTIVDYSAKDLVLRVEVTLYRDGTQELGKQTWEVRFIEYQGTGKDKSHVAAVISCRQVDGIPTPAF